MSRKFKLRVVQVAVLGLLIGLLPANTVKAQVDVPKFSDLIVIHDAVANANVFWLGGSGAYQFTTIPGLTGCVVISAPGTGGAELPANCHPLVSSGTFVNLVCGTGFANSGPPPNTFIVEPAMAGEGAQTSSVSYGIVFAAGVGVLVGDVLEDITGTSYPAIALGIVHLSAVPAAPNPDHNKLGLCTPGFTVDVVAVVLEKATLP